MAYKGELCNSKILNKRCGKVDSQNYRNSIKINEERTRIERYKSYLDWKA